MGLPAASSRKVELALPLLNRRHQKKGPRRCARSKAAPTWVRSLPRITESALPLPPVASTASGALQPMR